MLGLKGLKSIKLCRYGPYEMGHLDAGIYSLLQTCLYDA